jgi:hypothetical protein
LLSPDSIIATTLAAINVRVEQLESRIIILETAGPGAIGTRVSNLETSQDAQELNIQALLTSVAAIMSTPSGGGSSFGMTTIEINLGVKARKSGRFVIPGVGLTLGKPVLIQQAGGAHTGQGLRGDQGQFYNVSATGIVASATEIQCHWVCDSFVRGNVKFNYTIGV